MKPITAACRVLIASHLVALSACSVATQTGLPGETKLQATQQHTTNAPVLQEGSIVLARLMPEVSEDVPTRMLGFLPMSAVHTGVWLSIDRQRGELTLMENAETKVKAQGEGVASLAPGLYRVMHKQRSALWYAPDQYFTSRELELPPHGDRARYLRGALGEFVVFLNQDTPLHSGPVWTDEIGGVRLPEQELSRLYYLLDVGSLVEVR